LHHIRLYKMLKIVPLQTINTQNFSNKTIYEANIIINLPGKIYTAHLLSPREYNLGLALPDPN
jgi:hypothetical protein